MADISEINANGTLYNIKDNIARSGKVDKTGDTMNGNLEFNSGYGIKSSSVVAMTGYSKPLSYSAISISDTLNQAVGKLEASLGDINSVLEEVL